MQFSSRLSTAVHILLYLAEYEREEKVTSEVLADSTGVNAVNIRKILAQLKGAGLIEIRAGVGGAFLKKRMEEISLAMIFCAVEEPESELFKIHDRPNVNCPVGQTIQAVLDKRVSRVWNLMQEEMNSMYLSELYSDMQDKINNSEG